MDKSNKLIELSKLTVDDEVVKSFVEELESAIDSEDAQWTQPFAAAGKAAGKSVTKFDIDL